MKVLDVGTTMKEPDYLAINPVGKMPAITHGDVVVTEVAAICAYLADRFPEKALAPPLDSPLRGHYYRWLFFTAGPLEMAMTVQAYGWKRDRENVQAVGSGYYQDAVNALQDALKDGPYICGDRFTAADLYVGSYIGWGLMTKTFEPRPGFAEYAERVTSRPAAKRANELDDALMNS